MGFPDQGGVGNAAKASVFATDILEVSLRRQGSATFQAPMKVQPADPTGTALPRVYSVCKP